MLSSVSLLDYIYIFTIYVTLPLLSSSVPGTAKLPCWYTTLPHPSIIHVVATSSLKALISLAQLAAGRCWARCIMHRCNILLPIGKIFRPSFVLVKTSIWTGIQKKFLSFISWWVPVKTECTNRHVAVTFTHNISYHVPVSFFPLFL